MASYIFGIAMMVAVVLVAVGQKWPRIWVALRFPDSSTWPIISATVEQGIVQTYYSGSHTIYMVEIIYSYQVSGEYYSGRRRDQCNSRAEADDIVREHPKGSSLQIRVHPAKPDVSILG